MAISWNKVTLRLTTQRTGPSFAVIRPHSIVLVRTAGSEASTRNQWTGTITELDRRLAARVDTLAAQ